MERRARLADRRAMTPASVTASASRAAWHDEVAQAMATFLVKQEHGGSTRPSDEMEVEMSSNASIVDRPLDPRGPRSRSRYRYRSFDARSFDASCQPGQSAGANTSQRIHRDGQPHFRGRTYEGVR
jgi:hypothetical protein